MTHGIDYKMTRECPGHERGWAGPKKRPPLDLRDVSSLLCHPICRGAMRHGKPFKRLIALLITLAMLGGFSLPVWAGPGCPHANAHHHAHHHNVYSPSELAFANPDRPCKCDQHADMTMAECVALGMGLALPASAQVLAIHELHAAFPATAMLFRTGTSPERDPYPPKLLLVA